MSRIRANQITNQSADGAPTVQNGLVVSGVTTSTNVSVASSVTATTFYGSGANLTGVTQTTINNNADNRVITGSGTANTLEGESNLTFTGSLLHASSSHIKIDSGYSFQWGDSHERIEQSDGKLEFFTNNTEKVTLSGSNLGIGTVTPDQTVHIHKGSAGSVSSTANTVLTLENSTTNVLQFLNPNNTSAQIRFGDPQDNGAGFIDYSHNSNTMAFGVYGPTRMQLDSNGHLGIDVASTTQLANSKMLTIRPSDDDGIRLIRPADGNNNPNIHLDLTTTRAGSAFPSGEAYTTKYKTMNCDQIFETYEGGGTGGHISFRTQSSSGESLRIDKDGHVTTPSQPMCSYDLSSSIQSGNYITHNTVHTNNGNHYNTGNGRFVCPTAGYYYVSIMAMTNNSSTQLDIELHKNGSNPNNILVPYNQNGGVYNQVAGSCIIYCAANDYLQFKLNSGSVYNGRHGNASFALLA